MKLQDLSQAVVDGDSERAIRLTKEAIEARIDAMTVYRDGLIPGMNIVGKKMQEGEYFIPEVLLAADVMKAAQEVLKPMLSHMKGQSHTGKVVMGTVQGDLHDIGKNLVIAMLEGGGFEVVDAGCDVPPDKFVAIVKQEKPDILGLSALLSITMLNMKGILNSLESAGVRKSVKVLVGGAPLSQNFADEIGADGFAPDAGSAVELAKKVVKGGR